MSVYAITGELGTGKSLLCVSKIRDALVAGRRVATNLDLKLEHLVSARVPRDVLRVPDFPSREDLDALGMGCPDYDEKRFGLLVLDEAATFLNSRDFRQEGRADVIKWLLHSRKFRWDVFLIIQDLGMLDKQIRTAFVEHVVKCKRADRIGVPFLSAALSALGFGRVTFPQVHYAIVRYGTGPHALVVDRWIYTGRGIYGAYDTTQKLIGRVIAQSQALDKKTGEPLVQVLEKSLATVLCPNRAPWLRSPGAFDQALDRIHDISRSGGWLGSLASAVLPDMSAAESARRVLRLSESGLDLSPTNSPSPTYSEWLMARGLAASGGGVPRVLRARGGAGRSRASLGPLGRLPKAWTPRVA